MLADAVTRDPGSGRPVALPPSVPGQQAVTEEEGGGRTGEGLEFQATGGHAPLLLAVLGAQGTCPGLDAGALGPQPQPRCPGKCPGREVTCE